MTTPLKSGLKSVRKIFRFLALFGVLGVGVYANSLNLMEKPWPQWMDGRYGGPLPWGMFAGSLSCSTEVVGIVKTSTGTVEVGRPMVYPGVEEWLWTVDDSWHIFAWMQEENVDWGSVSQMARKAAGVNTGEVVFVLRERRIQEDGTVQITDIPLGKWDEACR